MRARPSVSTNHDQAHDMDKIKLNSFSVRQFRIVKHRNSVASPLSPEKMPSIAEERMS